MQIDLADRVIEQMSARRPDSRPLRRPDDRALPRHPEGPARLWHWSCRRPTSRRRGLREAAERKLSMPGLFDAIEAEAVEEPAA